MLALIIRIADACVALVLQVCLARMLGPAGYGEFAYAFAWLQLTLIFAQGGFATAALRYVAEYRARRQPALVRGFVRRGFQLSLLESVVLALVMIAVVIGFSHRLSERLTHNLLIISVTLPIIAQASFCRAVIRGLGHAIPSMLVNLARPLVLLVALLAAAHLFRISVSSSDALLLQLGAAICALSMILAVQWRFQSVLNCGPEHAFRTSEWLSMATQMMFVQGLVYLQGRTGVIVSGLLLDSATAGTYAAMERLADVALLGMSSVDLLVAPTFAALHAQRRRLELQRYARLAAWGATFFMLAAVLPLVLFGKQVLRLFGDEFVSGYPVLLVLLGGVAINAMCGSVCHLLNMTGHQRETVITAIGSLCLNLILLLILVPRFGIIGTSAAFAISMAVWNISMLLMVRRRLQIWSFIGPVR
jgi:O-antigen/teichoic acid export membrane protein